MNKQNPPKKSQKKGGPAYQIQKLEKEVESLKMRLEMQEVTLSALETEFNKRFSVLGSVGAHPNRSDWNINNVVPLFSGGYDFAE